MSKRFQALGGASIIDYAHPENTPRNIETLKFPMFASAKIDGWRMFEFNRKATCRSLKPPRNLYTQRILSDLFTSASDIGVFGLDGEICVGDPWDQDLMQKTTSAMNSIQGQPAFTYWIFDCHQFPEDRYATRLARALTAVDELEQVHPFLRRVEQVVVYNWDEVLEFEAKCLELGYEGVMLRSMDGRYKMGHSTLREGILMKLKRFEDDEAEIVGFKEEMENTNEATLNERGYTERKGGQAGMIPKGTCGAVILKSKRFEDTFTIRPRGDALCQKIWNDREYMLGEFVKYKYFAQQGVKDRPRFPKWIGIRPKEDMPV